MTELWKPTRTSRLWKRGDPAGLPMNGLIALYDPYLDTYGRNCVPTDLTGWSKYGSPTVGATTFREPDGATASPNIALTMVRNTPLYIKLRIKPVGVRRFFFREANCTGWASVIDTTTRTVVKTVASWPTTVTDIGDGGVEIRCDMAAFTAASSTPLVQFGTLADDATDYATHVCSASHGFDLIDEQPQINLVQLFPYSPPAGAPGTLQTGTDYSGHGNTLTYGATTNASTDDPAFTGTAWSFDGGDFLNGGRPAQLEIANPWWGFGVYYIRHSSNYECLVSKANNSGTDPGTKGFIVNKTPGNGIRLTAYMADSTRVDTTTASAVTEGWHWVSYGWDGTQGTLNVDRVDATPVAVANFAPDTTYNLTFGKYSHTNAIYFTGSLALAGFYSRYPSSSERMRSALYVKGLMAQRGITLP